MKKVTEIPATTLTQITRRALLGLLLLVPAMQSQAGTTITIGKGTGIQWEGLPFNVSLSGPMDSPLIGRVSNGILSISNNPHYCIKNTDLTNISGYQALKIAPGVGLVPRATGTARYRIRSPSGLFEWETFTGTIGLPDTRGVSSGTITSGEEIIAPIPSSDGFIFEWCLPPRTTSLSSPFYDTVANRTATVNGMWALVTDGSQTTRTIIIPSMYASSFAQVSSGDRISTILPPGINLRISTLECTASTNTAINFGNVSRNVTPGAELARQSYPLAAICGQTSDFINANINVQFRAISGLAGGATNRLALNQGGGYITGEIDNGVTGSGACNAATGITFDNTQFKLGSIASTEGSKAFSNQITWRLCSAGAALPTGPVDASAEMLVTYN